LFVALIRLVSPHGAKSERKNGSQADIRHVSAEPEAPTGSISEISVYKRQWNQLNEWFNQGIMFKNFPDYQFRKLIYSICTQNEEEYNFSSKYVADFIPFPQISRLLKSYADLYQIKELSDMLI